MPDYPLLNTVPRLPDLEYQPWRPIADVLDGQPVHPRCLCSVAPSGSVRQSGKTTYVKDAPERYYASSAFRSKPCECTTCHAVYGSRGVVSPQTVASCPWSNASYAQKSERLRWIYDPSPKKTEWPTITNIKVGKVMADKVFSDERDRVVNEILSAYRVPPSMLGETTNSTNYKEKSMYPPRCPVCGLNHDEPQGEPMSSSSISNSAASLADEVRALGRDYNADLSSISVAIKEAEAKRRKATVDALKAIASLEKAKNRKAGKEFVLVYQYDGNEYTVHGVDFGYGKSIHKDNEIDEIRVLLTGSHPGLIYEHYTMQRLRDRLDNNEIIYAPIEYLD